MNWKVGKLYVEVDVRRYISGDIKYLLPCLELRYNPNVKYLSIILTFWNFKSLYLFIG